MPEPENSIVMTDDQKRRQRRRNIAIGVALAALVVIFYAVTIVKIGGQIANRSF